ncbi:MAG: glycoside hydrolase family 2 [Clostridia bacterium]|nr:glycoside hydrolase family 2 [Clostridia bacterium]
MGEVPHSEHPMPQTAREHWLNLNGKWEFCKIDAAGNKSFEGEILVPFSPETLNSGVDEGFVLERGSSLCYSRTVMLDKSMLQGTTVLRFGAVDSSCEVFFNGTRVGAHRGGFTAFSFDVTDVCRKGENTLEVIVFDEATRNGGARGKQSDTRGGIWYTPQSGIWQTVWLESMPKKHIRNLKITPDAMKKTVKIAADSMGGKIEIRVFDNGEEILQGKFTDEITLSYDFELWSPEHPKLYELELKNGAGDVVRSYFGVRSFGRVIDKNGKVRLSLNGKPYFFNGVLDQGYWSDGMLTYPCDAAVIDELTMLKEMGFNTVRKHIKIEPMRWYYHCDRLGLTVWQDFINGGGEYKFSHVAALPFLGIKHKDSDYKYFARENAEARAEFDTMVDEILNQLYNTVSISVWVPFNEGWGQFDSAKYTAYVHEKDPTRIIDSVSGWHDQGVQKTALCSLHTYYTPLRVPRDPRPVVLSEFGGYSMKVEGHVFDPEREFGYKKFKTEAELVAALRVLYLKKLKPLIAKGLCGAIYTQVSDVEEEINGLVTYDRAVQKVPTAAMREINDALMTEAAKIE